MQQVIIIRGVSGSGKSTKAFEIKLDAEAKGFSVVICSADDYPGYYVSGKYTWSPQACSSAHKYCQEKFKAALYKDVDVIIVDNTNIKKKDFKFYIDEAMWNGHEVSILEIPFNKADSKLYAARNSHGVPEEKILQMMENYQR